MKKSLAFIVLVSLLVISAFSAQAFTIKSVLWGFGAVTGMATVPADCTDSDNSSRYNMGMYTASILDRPDAYASGSVNYTIPAGSTIFTDRCYNSVHLAEQFCQLGRYRGVQGITCPEGCSEGACIRAACTDTDNGVNASVAGEAAGVLTGATDYCDFTQDLHGILQEAVCTNGTPGHIAVSCPPNARYCRNGVCTADNPPVCTDSDGTNTNTRGNITERTYSPSVVHTDYCEDLTTFQPADNCFGANCGVREYSCQGQYRTTTYTDTPCPNGCSNGACLPAPSCTDSDGGINASVRGYLEVQAAQQVWADDCCVTPGGKGCEENGTQVMDFYCSPNSPNGYDSITLNCSNGCTQGVCFEEYRVLGPPIVAEKVTCMFVFPTKMPVCTSSKGNCTGTLGSSSTCTVDIAGTADETVTWTSDCGRNARAVTTTINGQDKNAAFICTKIRLPGLRSSGISGISLS